MPWALERANNKCFSCGANGTLDVHHKEPLKGEARLCNIKNLPGNLVVLCRRCHARLHAKMAKLPRYELAKNVRQPALFDLP